MLRTFIAVMALLLMASLATKYSRNRARPALSRDRGAHCVCQRCRREERYKAKTYYFCCASCKPMFIRTRRNM